MNEFAQVCQAWGIDDIKLPSPIWLPDVNRVDLAQMFRKLDYRVGVEIGVLNGDYSYTLATKNPQATIHSIDAWKVYRGYGDHTDHASLQQSKRKAEKLLCNLPNVKLSYKTSMESVKDFADNTIDFIYIDANHELPYVVADIYYWMRRLRSGGIMAGHDYLPENRIDGRCHVRQAATACADAFEIPVWFVIGKPERSQSWFWVKP